MVNSPMMVDSGNNLIISIQSERSEHNGRSQTFEIENSIEFDSQEYEEENSDKKVYTSQTATLFILINVTLGIGLLAMPDAMYKAGLVTSIILNLVLLILIITTCVICVELTVKSGAKSYHDMIRVNCDPVIYQLTQVSILLVVFGTAVAYIITIGDQSDRLFATMYGNEFCKSWYLDRKFVMIVSTIFLMIPLCCLKTVDSLKYASFLGLISIGFIAYVLFSGLSLKDIDTDAINKQSSLSEMTSILPIICFGYSCHLSLVPTIATIRTSEKHKAYITVTIMLIICTIVYMTISSVAVLEFGSEIKGDLIENFPGNSWSTLATIALVGFKCILTSPAAFLPARITLIDILTKVWGQFADLCEPAKRISVTVITLILALSLALLVPNITLAVNLLGTISVFFVFNLPALAYLNLVKQNRINKQQLAGFGADKPLYGTKDQFKRVVSYMMLIVGFILGTIILYRSVSDFVNDKSSNESLCKI